MGKDKSKSSAQHIDHAISEVSEDTSLEVYTPEEQKKIIRRIDRRLVATLGLLYMCSLMDRTNLSIAVIAG